MPGHSTVCDINALLRHGDAFAGGGSWLPNPFIGMVASIVVTTARDDGGCTVQESGSGCV